ncbi:hypothetical protein C8Q70DRAFT_911344, partial [Cubamyces menziesii]
HLNYQGVAYTMMQGDVVSTPWITASVTLFEVRNPENGPHMRYWALAIYPGTTSQRAQMVYLTADDWTIQWEETIRLVMFYCEEPGTQAVRYCFVLESEDQFLNLVYMCSNIRMYLYTGLLFV